MYAIIELSGSQIKVEKDDVFTVDRLDVNEEKATLKVDKVLFGKKGKKCYIGQPYIESAYVECDILAHKRGKKVIAFKYRERKSSQSKRGHRQDLTELKVKGIHLDGAAKKKDEKGASDGA